MDSKQNYLQNRPQLHLTHQPKPKLKNSRYPLQDCLDDNVADHFKTMKSIQASPVKPKNRGSLIDMMIYSVNNFRKNDISENEPSQQPSRSIEHSEEVSMSVQERFRLMHISSVHELIAAARQKKSEIEDLLRGEQFKAEHETEDEDFQNGQVGGNIRKLRKVVRMLEIVCKIIMGKDSDYQNRNSRDRNPFSDLQYFSQQSVLLKSMHQQSMENYEHQLVVKNAEIERLKRLVKLLSLNQKSGEQSPSEEYHPSQPETNKFLSINIHRESYSQLQQQQHTDANNYNFSSECNVLKSAIVETDNQQPRHSRCNQQALKNSSQNRSAYEQKERKQTSIQTYESVIIEIPKLVIPMDSVAEEEIADFSIREVKRKFQIEEVFSVWNIIDYRPEDQSMKMEKSAKVDKETYIQILDLRPEPASSLSFSIHKSHQVTVFNQFSFLKRYKSLLKITMKALHYLATLSSQFDKEALLIDLELQRIADDFNVSYQSKNGIYEDSFIKAVRNDLEKLWNQIQPICLRQLAETNIVVSDE